MTSPSLTYEQILVTNNLVRAAGEETYYLGVTRTVQESKFFPVSAYILLGYFNAFYRYPALLRKIERNLRAEDLADRVRNSNSKAQSAVVNWCLSNFYLLGREMLINMGVIRPHDAAEDLVYVMDFWRRFQLASRREDGHITCKEGGHRSQLLPERRVQVFHADLYPCEEGDALHSAADKFIATASQYAVLAACESRVCMNNHGPYNLGGGRELLVRDFFDLAEGDLPWLDGIAADVPYARLTVTTAVKDTHFYIVDDWGSFESKPEYRSQNICGIGLYTSDELTETHLPVGMGSREELTQTLERLAEIFKRTTSKLWQRLATYTRDQLLDAGALTYFAVIKDFAHIAGCYDADDWNKIDERAERFRPLLNDEYGNQMMGAHFVLLCCPSHQVSAYTLMHHSNLPKRTYSPLSTALLHEADPVPTVGNQIRSGITFLPEKVDRYRTSQGVMGLEELNRRTRAFVPKLGTDPFRYLDDTWVQYHYDTPLADELYRIDQQHSRKLVGKGAGLTRDDIERLADRLPHGASSAAPSSAPTPTAAERHLILHGLAIKKYAGAADIAGIVGLDPLRVASFLEEQVANGRVIESKGKHSLKATTRAALAGDYSRFYGPLRSAPGFVKAYEDFEAINVSLKGLITQWQVIEIRGSAVPNDHSDRAYDDRIIDRLGTLHERAGRILDVLAQHLPRMGIYRTKLDSALERAEDGAPEWVSDVRIESYHTLWFELHEDLLCIMGRTRVEEEGS